MLKENQGMLNLFIEIDCKYVLSLIFYNDVCFGHLSKRQFGIISPIDIQS